MLCSGAQSCLAVIPWAAAHEAPLSMGFSRQEHWSGFSRGNSWPGVDPESFSSCTGRQDLTSAPPGRSTRNSQGLWNASHSSPSPWFPAPPESVRSERIGTRGKTHACVRPAFPQPIPPLLPALTQTHSHLCYWPTRLWEGRWDFNWDQATRLDSHQQRGVSGTDRS